LELEEKKKEMVNDDEVVQGKDVLLLQIRLRKCWKFSPFLSLHQWPPSLAASELRPRIAQHPAPVRPWQSFWAVLRPYYEIPVLFYQII
jgi:hypothetical protein